MRNTLRFRNTLLSLNGRRFPNLTPRGASLAFSFIIGTYIAFSLSWAHLGISGGISLIWGPLLAGARAVLMSGNVTSLPIVNGIDTHGRPHVSRRANYFGGGHMGRKDSTSPEKSPDRLDFRKFRPRSPKFPVELRVFLRPRMARRKHARNATMRASKRIYAAYTQSEISKTPMAKRENPNGHFGDPGYYRGRAKYQSVGL